MLSVTPAQEARVPGLSSAYRGALTLACLVATGCALSSEARPAEDAGSAPPDPAVVDAAVATADDDGGPLVCPAGTAPELLPTGPSYGHVIARDGTLFYRTSRGIGRIDPSGSIVPEWIRDETSAGAMDGLVDPAMALDRDNRHLVVSAISGEAAILVDLDAPEPLTLGSSTLLMFGGDWHGATLGPDGLVYLAIDQSGAPSYEGMIESSPVPYYESNGWLYWRGWPATQSQSIGWISSLAFADDGTLLVAEVRTGRVIRLALTEAVDPLGAAYRAEAAPMARSEVAHDLEGLHSIAIDERGRLYASLGTRVVRIGADGLPEETILEGYTGMHTLEWSPVCGGLYVSTEQGIVRVPMTVRQRAVPWH